MAVAVYGLCYMLVRCTSYGEGVKGKSVLIFSFGFFLKCVTYKAAVIHVKVSISMFQLSTELK